MKKMMFFVITATIVLTNFLKQDNIEEKGNHIEVVKFMYSVNTYPSELTTKSFWKFPEEHARLNISIDDYGNFIEDIKTLPKNDGGTFGILKYAIIVSSDNEKDTIYADYELKSWAFKRNGKSVFYYNKSGDRAIDLRHRYSFFKECW